MVNKFNKKSIIITIIISLVILFIADDIYYAYRLSKNHNFVNAKIINSEKLSKHRKTIVYKYEVNNIKYIKSTTVSYFKCNEKNNKSDYCIGSEFKVIYYIENPNINDILLGKYERYKVPGLRNTLYKTF